MLSNNTQAPDFTARDINGNIQSISQYRGHKVLLSFYRYASCTFCNLRIAELCKIYPKSKDRSIQFIGVFQSPTAAVQTHAGALNPPFPIIGDLERVLYKKYEVDESSKLKYLRGLLNIPRLLTSLTQGFTLSKNDGDKYLIPADFLIDEEGIIHTAYYGKDISDHISLDAIETFLS